jgi:hypothetical protein
VDSLHSHFQVRGTELAAAVLSGPYLIRGALLPATKLDGDRKWLPLTSLRWLPQIRRELAGEPVRA